MLDLVLTSRLGVRFSDRPPMSTNDVEQRLALMRRTSARSFLALSIVRPRWVIQTDPAHVATIEAVLQATVELHDLLPRIHVVAREAGAISAERLAAIDFSERFLCLRLDSDDYYFESPLRQALERFRDEAVGTLIDFPRGFLVDLSQRRARRLTYSVQGPFYGVIATPDDPIAAVGHHGGAREGRVCREQLRRSWAQTVHSDNIFTLYRRHGTTRELKSMVKQVRKAHGSRPSGQLVVRPFDLVPLRSATQQRLHDLVR